MKIALLLFLSLLAGVSAQVPVETHGNRLKNFLFSNYNPIVAPSDGMIEVNTQIAISAIYEVESQKNKVTLGIYYRNGWVDPRLTWNPADYGGLTKVRILNKKQQRIWVPPVYVIDAQGSIDFPDLDTPQVQVTHEGYVYMSRPGVVSLLHSFQLQEYPYDTQNVRMRMVAYGYSANQIRYKQWFNKPGTNTPLYPLVQLSVVFRQHIQWKEQDIKGSVGTMPIAGKDVSYFQIEVGVKRKALTTNKIMIFPGVVICLSSFNTYLIRINDNLRIQVSASTLLTLILFLVMIIKFLPLQGANPDIEIFFMTLVGVVFCIIVFILLMIQYNQYYTRIQKNYQDAVIAVKNQLYKKKYKKIKRKHKELTKENLEKPLDIDRIQPILPKQMGSPKSAIFDGNNNNALQSYVHEKQTLVKKEGSPPRSKGKMQKVRECLKKAKAIVKQPAFVDNVFLFFFTCFFFVNQISIFVRINDLKSNLE